MNGALVNLEGNAACALGAIAAGCRFYAGYPITPSSEIAEWMAAELPRVDGIFIQMEDEIASLAAVIGASFGGMKAMTATSGPGFSLMQEHLGYAVMAEVPCVVVDVMRGGPSTGMPTRPSQGDIMQARWGTHGDHPIVVLAPHSVAEIHREIVRAFNLSEALRMPVVLLYEETLGHLVESVALEPPRPEDLVERRWADLPRERYRPFACDEDLVPAMAWPGDGYRAHVTGLVHDERGFPTQNPEQVRALLRRLHGKLERHRGLIERFEMLQCADAELLIVAIGIAARAARAAVRALRRAGIRAGLFRPVTLWPFPEEAFRRAARSARAILVPELNLGQLVREVERLAPAGVPVRHLGRVDGEPLMPEEIICALEELAA